MTTKKRHVTVESSAGAHVPGLGRLGKGVHPDVELSDEQIDALKAQGCEVVTGATKTKQAQEA